MAEKTANVPATIDSAAAEYLKKFEPALKDYAIRQYSQPAFLKSAMLAIVDSPALAQVLATDAGKKSLFNALRYAATTGLSLNPQEGKAALIPRNGQVQYQIMKNGMVELALESGKVEFITADYVKSGDKFSLVKSVHGDSYEFRPALADRGEVIGYFAALKLKSGATHVKWFTAEEISAHRKKYSEKSQMPDIGYGVKTVMKALLRSVSISAELDTAIGADDFMETSFRVEPGTSADDAVAALKQGKDDPEPDQGSLL